mmetsp:Transcript_60448/g.107743  ORF Transcript_60448/g.107743 Transcript_60448/m.107743 type:complete len:188 (-) Transcript_60448:51-614(-)
MLRSAGAVVCLVTSFTFADATATVCRAAGPSQDAAEHAGKDAGSRPCTNPREGVAMLQHRMERAAVTSQQLEMAGHTGVRASPPVGSTVESNRTAASQRLKVQAGMLQTLSSSVQLFLASGVGALHTASSPSSRTGDDDPLMTFLMVLGVLLGICIVWCIIWNCALLIVGTTKHLHGNSSVRRWFQS